MKRNCFLNIISERFYAQRTINKCVFVFSNFFIFCWILKYREKRFFLLKKNRAKLKLLRMMTFYYPLRHELLYILKYEAILKPEFWTLLKTTRESRPRLWVGFETISRTKKWLESDKFLIKLQGWNGTVKLG